MQLKSTSSNRVISLPALRWAKSQAALLAAVSLLASAILVGFVGSAAAEPSVVSPLVPFVAGPLAGGSPVASPAVGAFSHAPPAGDARLGAWSDTLDWRFVPIHASLDRRGRIFSYGRMDWDGGLANPNIYDIYDPVTERHDYRANNTPSDLFCSIIAQDPNSGSLMVLGGDRDAGRDNDYALRYDNGSLTSLPNSPQMNSARWYPSATPLSDGRILVQGGTTNEGGERILTPELYTPGQGFRLLPGAESEEIYGNDGYYYPRTWLTPRGDIFGVTSDDAYKITVDGAGSIERMYSLWSRGVRSIGAATAVASYDVGKAVLVGGPRSYTRAASIVDMNQSQPTVIPTASSRFGRNWANATVLPDGEVFVNGGSTRARPSAEITDREEIREELRKVEAEASLTPEMFDPVSRQWRSLATTADMQSRLYHSTQLLLPDGSVFTGGGGQPGAEAHRNARIYYPPYLFNGDGSWADRPSLTGARRTMNWGQRQSVTVSGTVDSAVLIRAAASTHATSSALRIPLETSQSGSTLTFTVPTNRNVVPPGDYMLFVISNGVPSRAPMVTISGGGQQPAASLAVENRTVGESGGPATVTIRRDGSTSGAVSVKFATSAGSATPGQDFFGTSEDVTIPAGQTQATVQVSVIDDDIGEGDETVNLRIWDGSVPITKGTGVLTILANDGGGGGEPTVELASGTTRVGEGAGTARVTINRDGSTAQALRLKFATSAGTATAGRDFFGAYRDVQFASGQRQATVSFEIIDDGLDEPLETVNVRIWDADTATITNDRSTVSIVDND